MAWRFFVRRCGACGGSILIILGIFFIILRLGGDYQASRTISVYDVKLRSSLQECLGGLGGEEMRKKMRMSSVVASPDQLVVLLSKYFPGCFKNRSKKFIVDLMNAIAAALEEPGKEKEDFDFESPWGNRSHRNGNRSSLCPEQSPLLQGPFHIALDNKGEISSGELRWNWPPTLEEVALEYQIDLELGGIYNGPPDCTCRGASAVIVPYRDRAEHLRFFLHYTHELLRRQQLCYVIIVVEQDDDKTFNKGQVMNSAFQYSKNLTFADGSEIDCFIFHDVDILSEDDRVIYTCRDGKTLNHIAPYIDKYEYRFCCGVTVGAAMGYTREQFEELNGYSNEYAGWGGEDDDMNERIKLKGFEIWRSERNYTRFKMVRHNGDKGNPPNDNRLELLKQAEKRQPRDGLNSLRTFITSVVRYPSHTRLKVRTNLTNEELRSMLV
ncbi:unnamed protein product [Clavelina lepadiformis]|uniref:Beta-1,4-galactosyltransferase n=1 Tax=Clavelina lepadiformis TaxID=159417 RepID=A0ABP0EVN7_CLALP